MEPLQSARANKPAEEVKALLASRGFDAVGVKEYSDGPVKGFVLAKDLSGGLVGDHLIHFGDPDLVPDSIHIPELFDRIEQRERVFVKTSNGVCGMIARTDLNKPPVRLYIFGLISLLEMHMQFWVATEYPDDSWQDYLTRPRLEKAQAVYELRVSADEGLKLLDCIQFCDKKSLFVKRHELLFPLQLPSKKTLESMLKHAEDLRNNLAHSQLDLVSGTTWEDLLQLLNSIQDFVCQSDKVVEELAGVLSSDVCSDELWISQLDGINCAASEIGRANRGDELAASAPI
jgi:hypothetical protein